MKILVFAGYTKSLLHFRKELLMSMVEEGNEVVAIGPEKGYEESLKEIGVSFRHLKFNRISKNPFKDLYLIVALIRIMKEIKPDCYFGYTIKPVIYGSLAARIAGIKHRYAMVTGLGALFIDRTKKHRLVTMIGKLLYLIGFTCCQKVFFQNPSDLQEMVQMKLIKRSKCRLVNGSGVNLDIYKPSLLPDVPIFLFVGSLLKDKGIREYMEAASIVKKKYSKAQFWIVGPLDQRVSAISREDLTYYIASGSIKYYGPVDDVDFYLDCCRFFVLPSYREGTPRCVLEAMAKGRPIITTDAPGCRETVVEGYNGLLVPIKNAKLLADKMQWMIEHPKEVQKMAWNSLTLVKEKYDVKQVNKAMLSEMGIPTKEGSK